MGQAMTPNQQDQIIKVGLKVKLMRMGGQDDAVIRAGLIAEGWPAAAVIEAMECEPAVKKSV